MDPYFVCLGTLPGSSSFGFHELLRQKILLGCRILSAEEVAGHLQLRVVDLDGVRSPVRRSRPNFNDAAFASIITKDLLEHMVRVVAHLHQGRSERPASGAGAAAVGASGLQRRRSPQERCLLLDRVFSAGLYFNMSGYIPGF